MAALENEASITMGQSPKSEFYNEDGEGLPFHQGVSDFGTHFPAHRKYCTVENRIAEAGDVLVSVRAPVGRINIANDRMVIGRGLSAIRSRRAEPRFLHRQLGWTFREEDSMGGGTIFKAINKKELTGLPVLRPPRDLVTAFEEQDGPMFKLVEVLTSTNQNLRQTRDLLLPRLISGEIDVSDLDIDISWLAA